MRKPGVRAGVGWERARVVVAVGDVFLETEKGGLGSGERARPGVREYEKAQVIQLALVRRAGRYGKGRGSRKEETTCVDGMDVNVKAGRERGGRCCGRR